MKKSPIGLSDAAANDIVEQAEWYEVQADPRLGRRWESAVSRALLRIVKNPRSGAPCNLQASELQGVQRMSVSGSPKHLIFYRVEKDALLILRVIHGARDLESLF
ncbi:MAG TPA: type II toxin-antitoxin system RelE/ParE family toxin [Terriglobales bacterium]|nr:type II toxin-antitoxin system RelE/ParE family toxin [Terriglobales bacterium]